MKRWWFSFRSQPKNKKDLKLIRFFLKNFGYHPKNLLLFKIAITHKSIANTKKHLKSNERLEFLGDTVLDAIIADFLYHKFPDKDEGYLTKVKAKIVSRKSLASIAKSMQLSEFLVYQKGRNIQISTLEGNALEAIVGAIYLDGGYQAVKQSISHSVMRLHVDLPTLLQKEIDFKSKLFIWSQRNKLNLEFKVLQENLKEEEWHYEIVVLINNNPYGKGVGTSKKMAEQAAAKQTLDLMG